jgi:dienelactone hydrolase
MNDIQRRFFIGLLALLLAAPFAGAGEFISPPVLWRDYDPDRGDFKEELLKRETKDGIVFQESYISAYVLGEEIRVFCKYSVKEGATQAPGLLVVHGWMGAPSPTASFVKTGWAVMAHDYCGQTEGRKEFTKYPAKLWHGNMDRNIAGPVRSETWEGKPITDPKQTSDYLWYAIQRRVLSYLVHQKEVDRARLGATGYSYGGTLMWALGTDPRVKAIVAYFGIGYTEYYRNKQVWMYNLPPVEPPKTSGEEIYLASIASEAYVPYITAATLFLNGSNDHHGGHERGLESFKKFPKGVPWAFAIQARAHHNTEKIEQNTRFWLEKHVLGREVDWPEHPRSELRLDAAGVPELVVRPASPEKVQKVEIYYALKNPCSFARSWRDAATVRSGDRWIGKLPVLNVEDYVFGYANVTYDSTIVRSTDLNAAVPVDLGRAVATDKPSDVIAGGGEALSLWTHVAEAEGPQGIKGLRGIDNARGAGTEQFHDPKWKAPQGAQLRFKFYCTEPQTLVLSTNNYYSAEIEVTASDNWQEMTLPAERLRNRFNQQPMKTWAEMGGIQLLPKAGSDLTKVIFAEFKWVVSQTK